MQPIITQISHDSSVISITPCARPSYTDDDGVIVMVYTATYQASGYVLGNLLVYPDGWVVPAMQTDDLTDRLCSALSRRLGELGK